MPDQSCLSNLDRVFKEFSWHLLWAFDLVLGRPFLAKVLQKNVEVDNRSNHVAKNLQIDADLQLSRLKAPLDLVFELLPVRHQVQL